MPLYLSRAHASRVAKPRKLPSNQRSLSLPYSSSKRTKALQRAQFAADELEADNDEEVVDPKGGAKVIAVIEKDTVQDVVAAMKHTRATMFEALPERAGMNSVRISEVLNFQRNLPPLVTLAHIHALRSEASKTEREIQNLLSRNAIRRVKLVGRGNEVSGLSELLIASDDYEVLLSKSGLGDETVTSFVSALKANPRGYALPSSSLPRNHVDLLIRYGFLVVPSISGTHGASAKNSSSVVAPATISRSASGSQAAVGGEAAFETLGGVNGARRSSSHLGTEYVLSVPGIAAYVQLLGASRDHFLDLLKQFSRHRQAPLYLLRERWNGNVDSDENHVSVARRVRGEFSNVQPAKTKKWKAFNGLAFDWVLEECLGAGLIELFDTHSVGLGIRALV